MSLLELKKNILCDTLVLYLTIANFFMRLYLEFGRSTSLTLTHRFVLIKFRFLSRTEKLVYPSETTPFKSPIITESTCASDMHIAIECFILNIKKSLWDTIQVEKMERARRGRFGTFHVLTERSPSWGGNEWRDWQERSGIRET